MPSAYAPTSSSSNQITSSLDPPIPVPTHGAGGSFSVLAKTSIAAPPLAVLEAVRDTDGWFRWNTFCPRCVVVKEDDERKGRLEVGMSVEIEVFMNGDGLVPGRKKSRDQTIVVTQLQKLDGKTGWMIAWKSTGFSHWQLHSERVMEFVDVAGGTEYVCWETFGGLLGGVVKSMVGGTLVERFGDYARDLKGFCEGGGDGIGAGSESGIGVEGGVV